MGKKRKGPKGRKVNFEIIPPDHEAYGLLKSVRDQWHAELFDARIALAWRLEQKPDMDGKIVLGKCVKISDLQKEFTPYDFVIVLNQTFWFSFNEKQQTALIDHELSHAAVARDRMTGELVTDTRGRQVYRCRKHDIEEFTGVVERHGVWKMGLVRFAKAIDKHRDGQGDLFEKDEKAESEPTVEIRDGQGEVLVPKMPVSDFCAAAEAASVLEPELTPNGEPKKRSARRGRVAA